MSDPTTTRPPALAVFCGSRPGTDDGVHALARQLGTALADAGVDLVYGGTEVGIMGTLADAVLAEGGRVVGVIPVGLIEREIAHRGLTKLIEVEDMHARKRTMYARADAFCALPGGYGTLDEVFEAATWTQLGLTTVPSRSCCSTTTASGRGWKRSWIGPSTMGSSSRPTHPSSRG